MPYFYLSGERRKKATKHVYIAIPTYGDIKAGCVSSLNAVQHNLLSNDISVDVAILSGSCHVDDARNDLCRMFLESEATHLMFIDADVEFSSKSVSTLLSFDEDIVCGVYPFKNNNLDFPVLYHDLENVKFDDRGLIDVKGVPGGFMCIARKVIQTLYNKNKSRGAWETKGDYGRLPIVEIFHRTVHMGRSRRSGDLEFCAKAIRAGYKVYVAPNLEFTHVGDNLWKGCLQTFLLKQTGHYERNAKAALARIRIKPDLADFMVVARAFGNEPFAADYLLLSVVYDVVKGIPGARVLETGTGVSTAVILAAGATLTSLEAEPLWGEKTRRFLQDVGIDDNPIGFAPIVDHPGVGHWYDSYMLDGEYDVIFCDGPRMSGNPAGIRENICAVMPEAMMSARVIIVDDSDGPSGHHFLKRLNDEFGFVFDTYKGPRREFAVGSRDGIPETTAAKPAKDTGSQAGERPAAQ